ncbi:SDR family oxidoreductase [Halorubrum sp. SD626R]|uniref:SDR family oxidoreductase n=1 Tax=Halorubrum sp. SD626R TaxID=1419722 RepID=UPI000A5A85B6|nr:SDR family oxidoreductase [Halorubrum sp. SD626R]TKX82252.1 SDR family oxidoreductase [Halorubrum sp. SD626R]
MPTALVTGVAGFIGSHLAEGLLDRGYTVRGIDNFDSGTKANLVSLEAHDAFSFTKMDVRDKTAITEQINGVDYVFHQAAVPSVPQSIEDPVTTTDINCTGTATVLDAAQKGDVDTVVVASTCAVYGSSEGLPKIESMELQPESPYALSKYYTEQLAVQFSEHYDIDTVALRYFNVFGPRQDPSGAYAAVIPKFIELMINGEQPVIFGDGEQSRDFVFVDDVVAANIRAAEEDHTGVLNIAGGTAVTINELVTVLNNTLDRDIEPVHEDPRPGDIRHSAADISKANKSIGFEPNTSFTEGIKRTIEWFQNQ